MSTTAVIVSPSLHLSRPAFDGVGVGTVSDRSVGCRGVIGPVPRPLWMKRVSLGVASDMAQVDSACWERHPYLVHRPRTGVRRRPADVTQCDFRLGRAPTARATGYRRTEGRHASERAAQPIGSGLAAARMRTVKPGWPMTAWPLVPLRRELVNLSTLSVWPFPDRPGHHQRGPRGLFLGEGYRLKFARLARSRSAM